MNTFWNYGILLLAALLANTAQADAIKPLPGDSIYQTELTLRDQAGLEFTLASLRGQPRIVSMIYTSCKDVCPLTVEVIKHIRTAVEKRTGHHAPPVVLVSFDPTHDSVKKLAMMSAMHHVAAPDWRLVRPEEGDVRAFAATLGISWRTRPRGEFSHNVEIVLLDAEGRIVAKTEKVDAPDQNFVDQVARIGN